MTEVSVGVDAAGLVDRARGLVLMACMLGAGLVGCSSDSAGDPGVDPGTDAAASDTTAGPDSSSSDTAGADSSGMTDTSGAGDDVADDTEEVATPSWRCEYTNPFSQGPECKDYTGGEWTAETAAADCASSSGELFDDGVCDYDVELGRCVTDGGAGNELTLVFPGDDSGSCEITRLGCETFAGGTFTPSAVCDDGGTVDPPTGNVFVQPYQVCQAPLDGEPEGQSADGEVCTWTAISACTEPGRRFAEYASCSDVLTQRPYWAYEAPEPPTEDERLSDDDYLADAAWVKEQVEACACVCCHSNIAPSGASGWNSDAGPLWMDTIPDSGLAMLAGLVDSTVFGAYPQESNNGFSRDETGVPTTDPERMKAILIAEYARRGFTEADAESIPPFGGPLYDQLQYEPEACPGDEGVGDDGVIRWTGGTARYLYVLEAGSGNPGVPPNLDEPPGTLWLVDVPTEATPMSTGFAWGTTPEGARQRIPESGDAPTLESGKDYYLVALRDVGIPITRCLFTMP